MSSFSLKAKIIKISIEQGDAGLFFATSPDLRGLLVAKRSREEAREAVPEAITNLYAACDVDVIVTEVEGASYLDSWVAVPTQHQAGALASAAA